VFPPPHTGFLINLVWMTRGARESAADRGRPELQPAPLCRRL